jgi:hypothetical protein
MRLAFLNMSLKYCKQSTSSRLDVPRAACIAAFCECRVVGRSLLRSKFDSDRGTCIIEVTLRIMLRYHYWRI